jgi:WXG100 family type VII secretion target
MAGGITVTPEQLQTISGQLASGESEIESILNTLAGNVAPLHTDWTGTAQAQFEELWTQWQKDAAGLREALEGISRLTAQAATAYAQTESDIARSFG